MQYFVRRHQIRLQGTDSKYRLVKYHSILYQDSLKGGESEDIDRHKVIEKKSIPKSN